MKKLFLTIMLLSMVSVSACKEESDATEGFERMGGEKNVHFVYVSAEKVGDKTAQRAACKAICEQHNNQDYCEVYMWDNKDNVQTSLPVKRDNSPMGFYTQKGEKVKLKALGSDDEE